ncbi:MAG: hypothetical protein HY023_18100, partial [Chloroflexi bacterium]|nr:hypothetical protein [Chloroflexota bacterium]
DTVKVSLNGHSAPVTARVAAHGRAPEGVALMSRSLGVTANAGAFVAKIEKA